MTEEIMSKCTKTYKKSKGRYAFRLTEVEIKIRLQSVF